MVRNSAHIEKTTTKRKRPSPLLPKPNSAHAWIETIHTVARDHIRTIAEITCKFARDHMCKLAEIICELGAHLARRFADLDEEHAWKCHGSAVEVSCGNVMEVLLKCCGIVVEVLWK